MKKLDKSKPHGQVWGDGAGMARFVQGGTYFDHEGNECAAPGATGSNDERPPMVVGQVMPQLASAAAAGAPVTADMIVAARRGELLFKALPILEGNAGNIVAELEDYDADMLAVLLEAEGLAKKRKSVIEALQAALAAKQAEDQRNAAANGIPGAGGASNSVDSQLGAQLSN